MIVVISQPMFFPWIGMFEQIKAADVFLHYDDVQMPQGRSFISRVQIKTSNGISWLTVPIHRPISRPLIKEVKLAEGDWRKKHQRTIYGCYGHAPFWEDVEQIISLVYGYETNSLVDFNIYATELIADYFGLGSKFYRSSSYPTEEVSSDHLLHLVKIFSGDVYVTGHGARRYIDYDLFEQNDVEIKYMDYARIPYPQRFGEFDPHVSILDLIANCGKNGIELMCSKTVNWKEFINE